jgi:hypothetical protein
MAVLGLLPPYTLEDVREAYRLKVLAAHPDRGGDAAEFNRLSEAYDRATEYVGHTGDRRTWIAKQVDFHLDQEAVAAEVRRRGGEVEIEQLNWLKDTWGDGFDLLASRLRTIRARGVSDGDALLAAISGRQLPYLSTVDLSQGGVTDAGLRYLGGLPTLQWLDLSGTAVTYAGLRKALARLPALERLNVKGTRASWLRRRLLAYRYPRVSVVAEAPGGAAYVPRIPLFAQTVT